MIEGFMKSIQNLLNVDLRQVSSRLSTYTREKEKVIQITEEIAVPVKDQTENPIHTNREITPKNNGSAGNKIPIQKRGFHGRIMKWFKSLLSMFKHH